MSLQNHNIYRNPRLNIKHIFLQTFWIKVNSIFWHKLVCTFFNKATNLFNLMSSFYILRIDAKIRPKVTNSNTVIFASPNWFEVLNFINNITDLDNDIENSKKSGFHVEFKRKVMNYLQNSKYIYIQKRLVTINTLLKSQYTFFKVKNVIQVKNVIVMQ